MITPTYEQTASNYELWGEYVDPHATMTEGEFDAMSHEELVQMQIDIFGPEPEESDDDEDQ
jgi:hypothetical protein